MFVGNISLISYICSVSSSLVLLFTDDLKISTYNGVFISSISFFNHFLLYNYWSFGLCFVYFMNWTVYYYQISFFLFSSNTSCIEIHFAWQSHHYLMINTLLTIYFDSISTFLSKELFLQVLYIWKLHFSLSAVVCPDWECLPNLHLVLLTWSRLWLCVSE